MQTKMPVNIARTVTSVTKEKANGKKLILQKYLYYNLCRPIVVYGVSAAVSVLLIKLKPKLLDLLFKKKFYRKM